MDVVQPPIASSASPTHAETYAASSSSTRPAGIERGEPVEQRAAGGGQIGAGEVLVDVVMGVDEARRDQAAVGPQHTRRLGDRVRTAADRHHGPAVAGHPAARQLAPVVVHRDHEVGSRHQQVDRAQCRSGRVHGHRGDPTAAWR